MKNKVYEKNLEVLKTKLPDYWKKIEEIKPRTGENDLLKVRSQAGRNGEDITVVHYGDKEYYLSGKYAPERMAQREVDKIQQIDMGTVLLVIGLSDGRVIRTLLERMKKGAVLLVYEPSTEIFLHTLEHYDISRFLKEDYTYLVVDDINGTELRSVLDTGIAVETVTKLEIMIQGNYSILFSEKIKHVLKLVKQSMNQLRMNWNTLRYFEEDSVYNIVQNYKYLNNHYSWNSLKNILPENVPVIVVAAGPSLDKNIEQLKEAEGKACVIACDTALKPLLRRGIMPDFFIVVDPRKPLELFDDEKIKEIPMISGLNIPPAIMEQHKGKKIIYNDTPFMTELFDYVFEKENSKKYVAGLASGGSVANSAFSAGYWMGAKTIILVGQDLALTGEKEHAEGTFRNDWKRNLTDAKYPLIEGVDGKMVPTLPNFIFYLKWFERQIEEIKTIKLIDATEGGALIHGSEIMTLKEAIVSYCQSEFYMTEKWNEIEPHFSESEKQLASEFRKNITNRINKIEKEIVKGKKYYTKLKKSVSKEMKFDKELTKTLGKIKSVNLFFEKDGLVDLISEGIKSEEYMVRKVIYQFEEDEQKNLQESAEIGLAFLERLDAMLIKIKPELEKLSNE